MNNIFCKLKDLTNSPVRKAQKIRGHFDILDGGYIHGWAVDKKNSEPVSLSLYINNTKLKNFKSGLYRKDLYEAGINNGYAGFIEQLDIQSIISNYGCDCEISVRSEHGNIDLNNSPKKVERPDIAFSIDIYEDGTCAGWVVDRNNTNLPLILECHVNSHIYNVTANLPRADLSSIGIDNHNHGFCINAFTLSDKEHCEMFVVLRYDKEYLIAPTKHFSSFKSKIKSLTNLQLELRRTRYDTSSENAHILVHNILPGIIDKCREQSHVPMSPINKEYNVVEDISKEIAIIIPVYKGVNETINCINSVLTSKNNTPCRIIIINDFSPEENMINALSQFNHIHNIEVFNNEKNLGFVETVNKGMFLAKNLDVILLNSDTIVPNGWLDAILHEAYDTKESHTIGTVTPLSNNATICSFPEFCTDNEIHEDYNVHRIAELCIDNLTPATNIPTAHGYCMFIKRKVLNEVGFFDQQKWGKGYAEENDFSLRATKLGWRHVVTNKTFIQHLGSVSFANDASEFISRNLEKLNSIYPDYPELIARFVKNDPVRILRNELAQKILADYLLSFNKKPMLFISLVIGGGTKVATDEMERLLNNDGYPVLTLSSKENNIWRLSAEQIGIFIDIDPNYEYEHIISILNEFGIWHIHYHHTLQFTPLVWDIPNRINCQYDVTLHDYYVICPRANMVGYSNKYCNNINQSDCNKCIADLGCHASSKINLTDTGGTINSWRLYHKTHLQKARRIFTPSKDTMLRINNYLNLDNIVYKYHPEEISSSLVNYKPGKKINIGFIGAIGPHKGSEKIKELAQYIHHNNINVFITIIGYTSDDTYFQKYGFVKITGEYKRKEIPQLLKENSVDILFISSIWPETFSYTFSEAVSSDCPIVSFKVGAIIERAKDMKSVLLLPLNSTPEEILKTIKDYFSTPISELRKNGTEYKSAINDYYNIKAL